MIWVINLYTCLYQQFWSYYESPRVRLLWQLLNWHRQECPLNFVLIPLKKHGTFKWLYLFLKRKHREDGFSTVPTNPPSNYSVHLRISIGSLRVVKVPLPQTVDFPHTCTHLFQAATGLLHSATKLLHIVTQVLRITLKILLKTSDLLLSYAGLLLLAAVIHFT